MEIQSSSTQPHADGTFKAHKTFLEHFSKQLTKLRINVLHKFFVFTWYFITGVFSLLRLPVFNCDETNLKFFTGKTWREQNISDQNQPLSLFIQTKSFHLIRSDLYYTDSTSGLFLTIAKAFL